MIERRQTTSKLDLVAFRDFESFEILKGMKVDVVCVVQGSTRVVHYRVI